LEAQLELEVQDECEVQGWAMRTKAKSKLIQCENSPNTFVDYVAACTWNLGLLMSTTGQVSVLDINNPKKYSTTKQTKAQTQTRTRQENTENNRRTTKAQQENNMDIAEQQQEKRQKRNQRATGKQQRRNRETTEAQQENNRRRTGQQKQHRRTTTTGEQQHRTTNNSETLFLELPHPNP